MPLYATVSFSGSAPCGSGENIFGVFVILASSARFAFPEINGMDRQLFVLFGFSGHQKYLSELRVFADSAVFKLQMERVIRHAAGCETAPGEHAVQRTIGFRRDERLVAVEGSAGIRKSLQWCGWRCLLWAGTQGEEHCFNVGNADTGVLVRPFGPSQKNSANGKRDFFYHLDPRRIRLQCGRWLSQFFSSNWTICTIGVMAMPES